MSIRPLSFALLIAAISLSIPPTGLPQSSENLVKEMNARFDKLEKGIEDIDTRLDSLTRSDGISSRQISDIHKNLFSVEAAQTGKSFAEVTGRGLRNEKDIRLMKRGVWLVLGGLGVLNFIIFLASNTGTGLRRWLIKQVHSGGKRLYRPF